MQEKLAEFNEALATKDAEERDALEREIDELRATNADSLKGAADRIAKATTDWSALESSTRNQLTAAQLASAKLTDQLQVTVDQLSARIAEITQSTLAQLETRLKEAGRSAAVPSESAAPATQPVPPEPEPLASAPVAAPEAPVPAPASATPAAPVEPPVPSVIESVRLTENPAGADEAKSRKPRPPRKPRPEETLAALSAEPVSESLFPLEAESSGGDEPAGSAIMEASASSDGATRLLVTAYIGIGNKLFIRGEGPGLSWDKGVPMQFVSIGKWGWASHDVTVPVRAKLYKNDDTVALSGDITVEPGKHVELTALF
jgi:hypothetical protein